MRRVADQSIITLVNFIACHCPSSKIQSQPRFFMKMIEELAASLNYI